MSIQCSKNYALKVTSGQLVAYYKFDELIAGNPGFETNLRAKDETSNELHWPANEVSDIPLIAAGKIGNAFEFDFDSQLEGNQTPGTALTLDVNAFNTYGKSFTIRVWVKVTLNTTFGTLNIIRCELGYFHLALLGDFVTHFGFQGRVPGTLLEEPGYTHAIDVWHRLILWRDWSTGIVGIKVNDEASITATDGNIKTSVTTPPSPATTGLSLNVSGTSGIVAGSHYTLWPGGDDITDANKEIVLVTSVVGSTVNMTRAQQGTTARTIVAGWNFAGETPDRPVAWFQARNGQFPENIQIDELGIWINKVWTEAEMTYDWNSGAGRTYPDVPT